MLNVYSMTYSHLNNLGSFFVNWCACINLCLIGSIVLISIRDCFVCFSWTILSGIILQFGTVLSGTVVPVFISLNVVYKFINVKIISSCQNGILSGCFFVVTKYIVKIISGRVIVQCLVGHNLSVSSVTTPVGKKSKS